MKFAHTNRLWQFATVFALFLVILPAMAQEQESSEKNAALVEINPLVITTDKRLIALDGKVSIDDNSLYKHADVQKFRDLHEEEPLEIEATNNNLNYVKLDGDIGCMVNGAGLAMATMDPVGRYAEHRARGRKELFFYQGTDWIRHVEEQIKTEMRQAFDCLNVELRPISGQMANETVFEAMVLCLTTWVLPEVARL